MLVHPQLPPSSQPMLNILCACQEPDELDPVQAAVSEEPGLGCCWFGHGPNSPNLDLALPSSLEQWCQDPAGEGGPEEVLRG